jgi:integrase
MARVNEAVVQQSAGHTSIATTLKYYTGIMPEALRAAQVQLPYMRVLKDISDTYHEPLRLVRRKSA